MKLKINWQRPVPSGGYEQGSVFMKSIPMISHENL